MDIPFVPDDPPPPPKKYNSKKKMSQYGQYKKQSSSAVSHHQVIDHNHPLASDVLSDALLPNEDPFYTPNKPRAYYNWRTTSAILSQDNIIQDETPKRIAVEEILVQEMEKRVAAKYKAHDADERRNNADHETRREKHVSNILIYN